MIRNYETSAEQRVVDNIGTALLIIVVVAALMTATALASTMWAIGQKTERTLCLREAARSGDLKPDCGRPGIVERLVDATLPTHPELGPTLLIAAMRCFVALRLGHEVELP